MDVTLLTIIRVGLSVLTGRLLTLLSLLMVFILSCWVMYDPSPLRMYVAGGFAILVFIPSIAKETKNERQERQDDQ
jgi:hypothetical protein